MAASTETTATDRRAPGTDTLADSVVILLALTVLQRLIGFGRGILFCRWLDPEELGQWDMAFSFLMLAGPLAVLSLPGSFGRYLEHFRARGQFRTFLRRTAGLTSTLVGVAAVAVWFERRWISDLVFGRPDRTELVSLLVFCLIAVVAFNFVTELFTAARMQRVSSMVQAVQGISFTAIGIALLACGSLHASSLVISYGAGAALAVLLSIAALVSAWRAAPAAAEPLSHSALWSKLIPFSFTVWGTNWLTNLFAIIDRYMLLHFSGLDPDTALAEVGQYHSSRLVPALFVVMSALLATLVMPYLSQDWEAGRREQVGRRVNLTLKLLGLAVCVACALVLVVAAPLFELLFHGKFATGLAVLPIALVCCVWASLNYVARGYLWCEERAGLGSIAYVIGLAVNIGLNVVLLPRYGLRGAVWSTTIGNLTVFSLLLVINRSRGMRVDAGTWAFVAIPFVFVAGPWVAAGVMTAIAALAAGTNWLFRREEKAEMFAIVRRYWSLVRPLRGETRLSQTTKAVAVEPAA